MLNKTLHISVQLVSLFNKQNKKKGQHGEGLHLPLCFFSNLLFCPPFLLIRSNQCWRYSLRAKADICAGQILQNCQMKANKCSPRKLLCVCVCVFVHLNG